MIVISVDGPAASGKGTVSCRLAELLNLSYLDTGILYRLVAACVLESKKECSEEYAASIAANIHPDMQIDTDLRLPVVSDMASKVAKFRAVRDALLPVQRNWIKHAPEGKRGSILDGRDIGTVVYPESDYKIFLTASDEIRAERRYMQLLQKELEISFKKVYEMLGARDLDDSSRELSPLVIPEGAVVLDTGVMTVDEVVAEILSMTGLDKEVA